MPGEIEQMELSATEERNRPVRPEGRRVFYPSLRSLSPLILVSALVLSGCGDKPPQPDSDSASSGANHLRP